MDSIQDFLFQSAGIFIFCIGVTIFFWMNRNMTVLIETSKEQMLESSSLFEQRIESISALSIGYQDIITILMNDLEYNITINGEYIDKYTHNYLEYPFKDLKRGIYIKHYTYNDDGSIGSINYSSE